MANYLLMFPTSKKHIEYMSEHLGSAIDYCNGEPAGTAIDEEFTSPEGWPTESVKFIDMEINHRNVDLYHWMLNKTPDPVSGAGSIFQTWLFDEHDAICLDKQNEYNEHFAFYPEKLPELLSVIKNVTPESIRDAYTQRCKKAGNGYIPEDCEIDEFVTEFNNFASAIETAIKNEQGLVWIVG